MQNKKSANTLEPVRHSVNKQNYLLLHYTKKY